MLVSASLCLLVACDDDAAGDPDASPDDDGGSVAVDAAPDADGGTVADGGGQDGGTEPGPPAALPVTNQTECFAISGDAIDCAGTGQDGDTRAGVAWPTPRFTVRGDGTVRDNLTGLVWLQRANCLGEVPWAEALTRSNTLADGECDLSDGSSAGDWRLPNLNELSSLIDLSSGYPAISNVEGTGPMQGNEPFRGVQNRPHWTSTSRSGGADAAWIVSPFASGSFRGEDKTAAYWTWPVRTDSEPGVIALPATNQTDCYDISGAVIDCAGTGQDGDLRMGVAWPVPRFTEAGNGTVVDHLTGLVWLRQSSCGGEVEWLDALRFSNELADGQCGLSDGSAVGDWRMPNFRELFSLMDWSKSNPTLADAAGTGHHSNGDPFTGVRTMLHWTSTTPGGSGGDGQWMMSPFAGGNIHGGNKMATRFIWPVRSP